MFTFPITLYGGEFTGGTSPLSWPSYSALSVAENAANSTSAGMVTASGGVTPLSYSIVSGNGAGIFAINTSTGEITVTNNSNLDYETTVSYSLGIRATDSDSPASTADSTITVNVTNVVELPVNTAVPVISGTEQVGQLLSATTGTWTSAAGSLSYAYQWRRAGVDISGATASSYTLVAADEGATITIAVTATNSDGSDSATSAATGTIAAASSAPVYSLDFDGTTDYLSMSDTNWGSYNRSKFAIAFSAYVHASTYVMGKWGSAGSSAREWAVQANVSGGNLAFKFYGYNAALQQIRCFGTQNLSLNTWYAVLITYDAAGAGAKMYINGTEDTGATTQNDTSTLQTLTQQVEIGSANSGLSKFDGLLYQPTFISGSIPIAADVFDGTAGKLKDLSGLTGAHSSLDASTATNDVILATDWTNHGTVTSSAVIP